MTEHSIDYYPKNEFDYIKIFKIYNSLILNSLFANYFESLSKCINSYFNVYRFYICDENIKRKKSFILDIIDCFRSYHLANMNNKEFRRKEFFDYYRMVLHNSREMIILMIFKNFDINDFENAIDNFNQSIQFFDEEEMIETFNKELLNIITWIFCLSLNNKISFFDIEYIVKHMLKHLTKIVISDIFEEYYESLPPTEMYTVIHKNFLSIDNNINNNAGALINR